MTSYADTQRASLSPEVRMMIKSMMDALEMPPDIERVVGLTTGGDTEEFAKNIIKHIQTSDYYVTSLNPLACVFGYQLAWAWARGDAQDEKIQQKLIKLIASSSSKETDDIANHIFTYLTGNKNNVKFILIRYKELWKRILFPGGAATTAAGGGEDESKGDEYEEDYGDEYKEEEDYGEEYKEEEDYGDEYEEEEDYGDEYDEGDYGEDEWG